MVVVLTFASARAARYNSSASWTLARGSCVDCRSSLFEAAVQCERIHMSRPRRRGASSAAVLQVAQESPMWT